ncbi:hypothetical protein [Alkalihalobacillus sp. AL-G]|uniref:hypothetical protein n=1 Tax=Alkalihalobacillus sp. AL-G TaxID=2926399 RepID=UPI00272CC4CF|nr:hypothetical protein [Alkalihalobacillus sp. AL-G]WLD92843.1 hypothetical protein MOJ78_17830 [Alkalihalobacillus sp. AL-G]
MAVVFTILFFLFSILGIILSVSAIKNSSSKMYFFAGLLIYAVSFLGSFSIGLYILVFTFILWILAIANQLMLLKKPSHHLMYSILAVTVWFFAIIFIDDYWLFYPFAVLF